MLLACALAADPAPCEGPVVCVPVPSVRKTTTWAYSAKPVTKCVPGPAGPLAWLFGHKGGCCLPPIHCHALMKRKVTAECPGPKCEPRPACPPALASGGPGG